MVNNHNRAAQGEKDLSSLQSSEAGRGGNMTEVAAETRAPAAVEASWDPYQVWLTRVKQPREQSVRTRRQARAVAEQPSSPDLSETARLRALTIVR